MGQPKTNNKTVNPALAAAERKYQRGKPVPFKVNRSIFIDTYIFRSFTDRKRSI